MATLALVVAVAAPARAFLTPRVISPRPVNAGIGPCRDAQVAATGPDRLTLGWTAEGGAQPGVWIRSRLNYVFSRPIRLDDAGTTRPRDLVMAYDAHGRLHLAWTAIRGDRRVALHAWLDSAERSAARATTVLSDLPTSPTVQASDADLPNLATDAQDGGALVTWEQAQGVGYVARAARVAPDGAIRDLGRLAGSSLSALNPRILTVNPPRVALDEIGQFSTRLRVDEWNAKKAAWTRSDWEKPASMFEPRGQVQLFASPSGDALIGCWQQRGQDGGQALGVGRADLLTTQPLSQRIFSRPVGQHGSPSLSGASPLTLAWQVSGGDDQAIMIAPLAEDSMTTGTRLSLPSERFAAMPAHATVGDWSAVAWIDDARDGGDGGLYFAEVAWLKRQ